MSWRCAAVSLLLLSVPASAKTVRFDGLAADYTAPAKGRPVAILVHGLGAGRAEYAAFASTLAARGWGALALDLRWSGPKRPASELDWPMAAEDIVAAARWLGKKGVDRVVLIGGSLGANLCSLAFARLRAEKLVLLSPGVDYRGVGIARFDGSKVLAAYSAEDRYARYTVGQLKMLQPSLTVLEAESGHGAQMLSQAAFAEALVDWLSL